MPTLHDVAFALYLCVCAALLYFGVRYLFQNRCMAYHEEALGRSWESLDPALKALLLGMQKIMGGGMLAAMVAGCIVLFEPFRRAEPWATWSLLLMLLTFGLPTLYATIFISRRTGARTPFRPTAILLVLTVAAFALSLA